MFPYSKQPCRHFVDNFIRKGPKKEDGREEDNLCFVIFNVAPDGPPYFKALGTEDHRALGHGPVRTLGASKTEGRRKLE
jgi:hypothetical protein